MREPCAAPVLLLDEPTATLDPRGEYELFETINKECSRQSVIFISHGLSNVFLADEIMVLDNGSVEASFFRLSTQQISNLGKVDKQIIIDIDLNCGIKRLLDIEHVFLKIVDGYCFTARIYNPVFAHSVRFIVVCLSDIIICRIVGGDNLNNKVGSAITTLSVQFVFIAYNHEIRLNNGEGSVIQLYIKWSMEHPAWSIFTFEISVKYRRKFHGNCLVILRRTGHIIDPSIEDFCPDIFR